MTPHADLVARLRAIASANICDLLNMGDESHEPPEITWGELDDIGRAAQEAADALAALPPPADPPHDCEAWRLEGLGCARCNKADPPALVALVREWQRKQRGCDIENTAAAYAELDIAEAELLAYPLPAAPPVPETPQGWQPIETAPKDGTVIDVWMGDADASDVEFYCGRSGTRRAADWSFHNGKFRPALGLLNPLPTSVQPTHWQPLPAAPAAPPQEDQ